VFVLNNFKIINEKNTSGKKESNILSLPKNKFSKIVADISIYVCIKFNELLFMGIEPTF
jgi:hypothetical protein